MNGTALGLGQLLSRLLHSKYGSVIAL